jgi:hypothetical protein
MQIFLKKVYLDLNTSYVNLIWELQVKRGSNEYLNYKQQGECRKIVYNLDYIIHIYIQIQIDVYVPLLKFLKSKLETTNKTFHLKK